MEKNQKISRKNLYLILMAAAIVVIGITLTIILASSADKTLDKPKTSVVASTQKSTQNPQSSPTAPSSQEPSSQNPTDSQTPSTSGGGTTNPVDTKVVFLSPLQNGTVLTEYTAAGLVYNKTLGKYCGHMAIDFISNEGAKVTACYDGTVKSITTSYLEGTTVTLDHGGELYSVYNSIAPLEDLTVGQTVKAGDVLGEIAANNLTEYKDGAHLHFEVIEDGKKVDPYKYLSVEEK